MGSIKAFFRRHRRHRRVPSSNPDSPTPPTPGDSTPVRDHDLLRTPPVEDAELERVFRKFDSNGDGKISSDELASIFESLGQRPTEDELRSMMAEADSDGDGFISLPEFVDLNTRGVKPDDALEDLREAFSVFDLDRNGSISAEELAKVMRSLGEAATTAQCRRMIGGVDADGDGLISFEEFRAMMMAGTNLADSLRKVRD